MCNLFHIQLKLGFLIATFGLALSCLITNCPRGGKRSDVGDETRVNNYAADCAPCGLANEGVCVGRGICCERGMGCHTSPRHCRNVSTFQISCLSELTATACGENGRCKSGYMCCSKDRCVLDMSCKSMPSVKYGDLGVEPSFAGHALPSLIQRGVNNPTSEDGNWKPEYD